ncbi:hypothetical protein [Telmatospirillum sp. J64-1]|uniref:hypothetical protein n=1 Tax=Telmatospirillum sp. J64-1 TaxID=2502183 RepID=UPI00115C946B|nr:hypothetical protein [Telmatospirillum sp. J64-1]
MAFNPLSEKGIPIDRQLRNWSELNMQPYDKKSVPAYSRCRGIVMNGIEVEAVMFGHQMARHTIDMDLKRQLAMTRRVEQQQQKAINWLIPGEESTLEVTVAYEQVAVDLTAWVAQNEPDSYAKQVYEFGLLEDFDHLYRYANLLDMLESKKAEEIVQGLTEIMPGRPTNLEHRHPFDDVRMSLDRNSANPISLLHALTVTAAEQQTMNFYMNIGNRPQEPIARALYLEIAQIEEQHVTQYESLMDAGASWTEMLVLHEYNECYMYYSFMQQEEDPRLKQLWELHLNMEIEHLRIACDLLRSIDRKDPEAMLPKEIPEVLTFQSNKEYIRRVLADQLHMTADGIDIVPVDSLPKDHRWYNYRKTVNGPNDNSPTEEIINQERSAKGDEYRLQTEGEHPVDWLRWKHAAE